MWMEWETNPRSICKEGTPKLSPGVKESKEEQGITNERNPDAVERRSSGDSGGAEGEAGSETDDGRETEVGGADACGEVGGGKHLDCE